METANGKWEDWPSSLSSHLPFTISHSPWWRSTAYFTAQQRELFLLGFAFDDDRGFHQDEQNLLVLGHRSIGEQPLEERNLGENRNARFAFDFAADRLSTEQERATIGD